MGSRVGRVVAMSTLAVLLSGATFTIAEVGLSAPAAHAARQYDIGDGDTLLMLSPEEAAAYLRVLQTPGASCNPIPGLGGSAVEWVAGKLSRVVGKISSVCGAYSKLRWVMNEQVRWALQNAVWHGGCFALVVDTARWRGPKVRVAVDDTGQPNFWVSPNTVVNFENRDGARSSLPIRCTSHNPVAQTPVQEQVDELVDPAPEQAPLEDPVHEDTPSDWFQDPSAGSDYQPQTCVGGVCVAIGGT